MRRSLIFLAALAFSVVWTHWFSSLIPEQPLVLFNGELDSINESQTINPPEYLYQELSTSTLQTMDQILLNNQPSFTLKTLDNAHALGVSPQNPLTNLRSLNPAPPTPKQTKNTPPEEDAFLKQAKTQFIENF